MGFLAPQFLLYGFSLALLALIYFRSRARRTVTVSSLMLFAESPAPAARMKRLRIDPLFWLEVAALGALTIAAAGPYLMMKQAGGGGRNHALIFDLGAAMSARDGSGTRLDTARAEALGLLSAASSEERFSVVSYALEARLHHPPSTDHDSVRRAILRLRPSAVGARPAALRAALMRSGTASAIDVFSDRAPAAGTLAGLTGGAQFTFHPVGSAGENLAIVELDPGEPGSGTGRCVVKNFGRHAHLLNLTVEAGGRNLHRAPVMLAPRQQRVVGFPAPRSGGLVHARITNSDAIAADNDRYAYAGAGPHARLLVLSPDPAVRDDLARVLLAIDRGFVIRTSDPKTYSAGADDGAYRMVVMHDCYLPVAQAGSTLLIYPPRSNAALKEALPGLRVVSSVATARMRAGSGLEARNDPADLRSTRIVEPPPWMETVVSASAPGHPLITVVAAGEEEGRRVGLIAFDVRDHFLLHPDRLSALVAGVRLMRRLASPRDLIIASTGENVTVPALGSVDVTRPDGSRFKLNADRWGRVGFRPLQAGRYRVRSEAETVEVIANYFDAVESDVAANPATSASPVIQPPGEPGSPARSLRPRSVSGGLIVLALIALLAQSALLFRRAGGWGIGHV